MKVGTVMLSLNKVTGLYITKKGEGIVCPTIASAAKLNGESGKMSDPSCLHTTL